MNTRHAAAVDHRLEVMAQLREEIRKSLRKLVELEPKLDALAQTRQTVAAGLETDETRARRDAQTRLDRAAARGYQPERPLGLDFLNVAAAAVGGVVAAPATIAAVSALAEIHFGLLHHLRRLSRPALLVALEHEQTLEEDAAVCPWPRHPIVVEPLGADATIAELAVQLVRTLRDYQNRPGLQAILDDLDRLEEAARTALDGPARTNHPDPCPWCGRDSLVIHHREDGRPVQVIRCEGRHECHCDFEWCPCHRNPFANRHEWVNSGRATNTWHQLHNLQTSRKEALMLETRATDALEEIRALHGRALVHPSVAECPKAGEHAAYLAIDQVLYCLECPMVEGETCRTCRDDDGDLVAWPCQTYRLTDLDGELDELPSIHDAGTIVVPDPKVDES